MQRTTDVDTMSTTPKLTGKRQEMEQRLTGLTVQVLRERAATASGPVFAEQEEVWGDLDRAYHLIRTALGRVRGETRSEA